MRFSCGILVTAMYALLIVVVAHFLYAIVALSDKFVVDKSFKHPIAYAFFINALGGLAVLLLLLNPSLLWRDEWFYAAVSGLTFLFGTVSFFHALQSGSVSRIPPLVGGATALFTALVGYLFFGDILVSGHVPALLLLILGIFFIAAGQPHTHKSRYGHALPSYVLIAGLMFALSALTFEKLTASADFIPAFAYSRGVAALGAFSFLPIPTLRENIAQERKRKRKGAQLYAPLMKAFGAVANVLVAFAISILGAVTVNALIGLQYLFILPLALVFSKKFPTAISLPSTFRERALIGMGTLGIAAGLFLITRPPYL